MITENMHEGSFPELLGGCLRHVLDSRGMTQTQFADLYHVDVRTVSRYINEGISKTGTVDEICLALGMSKRDFISYGN